MNRKRFLKNIFKGIIVGFILVPICAESTIWKTYERISGIEKNPAEVLKEIYKEVKELGDSNDKEFLKREFFLDLDHCPANREEHLVVLIHTADDRKKMIVQVTYFEPTRKDSLINIAKDTMSISCFIEEDKIKIEKSDYKDNEIKYLLKEILQGIREEKKLLKLIEQKKLFTLDYRL